MQLLDVSIFASSYWFLNDAVGLAASEVFRYGHLHDTEHGLPEVPIGCNLEEVLPIVVRFHIRRNESRIVQKFLPS